MVRLHLIGFSTDLKNLIFAARKGAKSGGYVVGIDARLRRTLEEVARLEQEAKGPKPKPKPKVDEAADGKGSKLSPKEIQALLRQGKTAEQVAKAAETDISWIQRFASPIMAERAAAIEAVRSATISKPRLGPSGENVGSAVAANLQSRKVTMEPDAFEQAWNAVRKDGRWNVSFTFNSRGQRKLARFSYDPDQRAVTALNPVASDIGWRSADGEARSRPVRRSRKATRRKPAGKSGARKSTRSKTTARAKPRTRSKTRARRG